MRSAIQAASRRAVLMTGMWTTLSTFGIPASYAAGGPSSLSGKPRPETGVVLLEPVIQSGTTIRAELLCSGSASAGVSAVAVFDTPYPVAKGNYYDVEARTKEGEASFIHVAALPTRQKLPMLETLEASFFTDAVLGATGRFGSYSAPQITSVSTSLKMSATQSKLPCSATRFIDVSFNALTSSGFEVPRRGVIAALQPEGSTDVLMLLSSVSALKWKKGGEDEVRRMAESFRIASVRPSKLLRSSDNDYRYASRGIRGLSEDESEIEAALARDLSTQSGSLTGKFAAAAAPGSSGAGVAGYAPNF